MDSNFSTKTIIKKYKDKLIFTGIFLLSFVTKFAGSNYFINTDAAGLWRYRIEDFWTAIANFNLELMPEVYHGITLMWLSGLSLEIANFLKIDIGNPDIYLYVAKFPLIAVVSLTTAYAYILFKKIFNNRALSTAICFFILIEPMFLFHAKNIHTNALAFCFSLLCVLHFFLFLKNKNKKELFFSALFMSLSLLTRSTTMIVFFAISVFYLFFYSEYKLKLKYLFYWFGLILLLFFIFWPSLWVHPLECADYFFEKIMFGVLYPHDYINSVSAPVQQYFFYFLYVLIKMPLIILSFFLIFIFLYFNKKIKFDKISKDFIRMIFLLIIFYFFAFTVSNKKVAVYIFPVIMFINILSAIGFYYFIKNLLINTKRKKLIAASFILLFLIQIGNLFSLYPYYNYNNFLYNFLYEKKYFKNSEAFSLGRGEGYKEAAEYFRSLDENIVISSWYSAILKFFYPEGNIASISKYETADYTLIYYNQISRGILPKLLDKTWNNENVKPEKIIKINGIEYIWIYKNTDF